MIIHYFLVIYYMLFCLGFKENVMVINYSPWTYSTNVCAMIFHLFFFTSHSNVLKRRVQVNFFIHSSYFSNTLFRFNVPTTVNLLNCHHQRFSAPFTSLYMLLFYCSLTTSWYIMLDVCRDDKKEMFQKSNINVG